MYELCRTCGMIVYSRNPQDLFKQPKRTMLKEITLITGYRLLEAPKLPTLICQQCELSLQAAIAFRHSVIKTQHMLQSSAQGGVSFKQVDVGFIINAKEDIEGIETSEEIIELEEITQDNSQSDSLSIKLEGELIEETQYSDNNDDFIDFEPTLDTFDIEKQDNDMNSSNENYSLDNSINDGALSQDQPINDGALNLDLSDNAAVHQDQDQLINDGTLNQGQSSTNPTDSLFQSYYNEAELSKSNVESGNKNERDTLAATPPPPRKTDKRTPTDWSKYTDEETKAIKRERRTGDYICEHCGKHFTNSSNFKVHILIHTGVKNYNCELCPQKFYTLHLLRVHLRHHRGGGYQCRHCSETFNYCNARLVHERRVHTFIKPYKCNECDKSFEIRKYLEDHMNTHKKDIRLFQCETCDVSFVCRKTLLQHNRSKTHKAKEKQQIPSLLSPQE